VDSIAIDTGSQLSRDALMSCYGRTNRIMPRDRGEYNQLMSEIYLSCRLKHLLVTHEAKEIWIGPENNRAPSGRYDLEGWNQTDYKVNVTVEHEFVEPKGGNPGRFYLSVRGCNDAPSLLGDAGERLLADDQISFAMLAMNVHPDWAVEISGWV
jgi:hypothetical protein